MAKIVNVSAGARFPKRAKGSPRPSPKPTGKADRLTTSGPGARDFFFKR